MYAEKQILKPLKPFTRKNEIELVLPPFTYWHIDSLKYNENLKQNQKKEKKTIVR